MFDLSPSAMDLAPGPDRTETLKSSVVELNVVETGDASVDDDTTPSRPAIAKSKSPTSDVDDISDESGEEWETDSLYEEALHFVRDDQLSSGEYFSLTCCHSLQAPDRFVI